MLTICIKTLKIKKVVLKLNFNLMYKEVFTYFYHSQNILKK